jgi:hypothetical protein
MKRRELLQKGIALGVVSAGAMVLAPELALSTTKRHGWRVPPICPPLCNGDGEDHYYLAAAYNHTALLNTTYNKIVPTKSQLLAAASLMTDYADARKADGTINAAQNAFLGELNTFYKTNGNGDTAYSLIQPFGNQVPAATFQSFFNSIPLATKEAIVAYIQQNGFYALLVNWAATLTDFANREDGMRQPKDFTTAYFIGMGATGGLMMMIPGMEGFGVIFFIGGTIGSMYCAYEGGCGT